MRLTVALAHRFAQWQEQIQMHGYLLERHGDDVSVERGMLGLRSVRPIQYGGPPTTIHVSEVLLPGIDPHSLAPAPDGCYLHHCSWHAQIGDERAVHVERLDIDRSKPIGLMRHRHPYGRPNAWREPTTINTPSAWMLHIETIVSSLYPPSDDTYRPRT